MFGHITINPKQLSDQDKDRYQAVYCGLCRTLDERHGKVGRSTLTYDMTFLSLLLSSLYQPEETQAHLWCLLHPTQKRPYAATRYTEYAADMNVILAYYKALDDWQDDKSLSARGSMKLLEKPKEQAAARWPRQVAAIEDCLYRLGEMERADELNPDLPANCFGELMGELFVLEEDEWSASLRRLGAALGRFVYLMDAAIDLPADIKHDRYNPLIAQIDTDFSMMLSLMIGECTAELAQMPLERDVPILRNILYSGVWLKYKPRKNGGTQTS